MQSLFHIFLFSFLSLAGLEARTYAVQDKVQHSGGFDAVNRGMAGVADVDVAVNEGMGIVSQVKIINREYNTIFRQLYR